MANYSKDELENDWEFKIVRSETAAFRKPEVFQQLVQEEAVYGWEMVEKLDDRRVRFKRRKEDRRRDANPLPGIDPYRTQFGGSGSKSILLVAASLGFVVILGIGMLISMLSSGEADAAAPEGGGIPWVAFANIAIIGVMLVGMAAALIARRR